MNTSPQSPVIVVTEEKKRRRGMIWIAGGAAVAVAAIGGGTFALWSDSAAFDGGTITAGDLDLIQVEQTRFYDVSPDREDIADVQVNGVSLKDVTEHLNVSGDLSVQNATLKGHLIDSIADWRMVPGDTVAAVLNSEVRLVGDNLVAELSVDKGVFAQSAAGAETLDQDGNPVTDADGFTDPSLTYTYTVFDGNGDIVGGYDHVAIDPAAFDGHLAYFEASNLGQDSGAADAETGVIYVGDDGVEKVTVVFEAVFQDTNDRVDVGAAEAIGGINLKLSQLRSGTVANDGVTTGVGAQQTN